MPIRIAAIGVGHWPPDSRCRFGSEPHELAHPTRHRFRVDQGLQSRVVRRLDGRDHARIIGHAVRAAVAAFASRADWTGQFAVVEDELIRLRALLEAPQLPS